MNYRELLIFIKNTEVMTRSFIELNQFYNYQLVTDRYVISKTILKQEDLEIIKNHWNDYRNENYLSTFTIGK